MNRFLVTYADGSTQTVEYPVLCTMDEIMEWEGAIDILFIAEGVEM